MKDFLIIIGPSAAGAATKKESGNLTTKATKSTKFRTIIFETFVSFVRVVV